MAVGASPDTGVEGVRAREADVSVGGDAVAVASVAVGAAPDPGVEGVGAGEADVSVGVDAVPPDGSPEPQAASAAVRASARTTLNRVTYLVVRVLVIFFLSRS